MRSLSVDVGTSVVKVAAFEEDGSVVAVSRHVAATQHPGPDRSEQDPRAVRDAVLAGLADATTALRGGPPAFVAVTAQGDGVWLVDADGVPVRPAMLWNDARATAIVERWRADGLEDKAGGINGSALAPGLPHVLLAWLCEHEPEALTSAAACLSAGSWVHRCLTGRAVGHVSDLSNPFLELSTGRPSSELLELLGLASFTALLPPLGEGHPVTPLLADVAATVGMPAGTPVVQAPYDVVSTALGAGATRVGAAAVILGTTLCAAVLDDKGFRASCVPGLLQVRTGLAAGHGPGFLRGLATFNGTEILDWCARLLGLDDAAVVLGLAEAATPARRRPVFHPYLSTGGERAPFTDATARGSLLGLDIAHGPADLAAAVVDGLACAVAECLSALDLPRGATVHTAGGGARSRYWLQRVADITAHPVARPLCEEAGALGARIVGLLALGAIEAADEALPAGPYEVLTPGPEPTATLERFRCARALVEPTWRGLPWAP